LTSAQTPTLAALSGSGPAVKGTLTVDFLALPREDFLAGVLPPYMRQG
jgi:hypothetical protein